MRRGSTFLEVLVVVAIVAIVFAIIFGAWAQMTYSNEYLEKMSASSPDVKILDVSVVDEALGIYQNGAPVMSEQYRHVLVEFRNGERMEVKIRADRGPYPVTGETWAWINDGWGNLTFVEKVN